MRQLPKLLSFAAVFGAFTAEGLALSAGETPECKLNDVVPDRITKISGVPSYFSKVTADGRYMCWISESGNVITDLDHANTSITVPGPFDPVPVPPSGDDHTVKHLTIPNAGMQFFSFPDITSQMEAGKSKNATIDAQFSDEASNDNYQSVGVLPGNGNKPTYRVLTGSLSISDYDTSATPWKILKNFTGCGDAGTYQLPMISKDGQNLSAYDTTTGTTKIFTIQKDGKCKEELDLGFATGKVEFSYNNKAITFHMDTFSGKDVGAVFSGITGDVTKNVYVLELKRKHDGIKAGKLTRITSNTAPGNGSYYPSFTEDGRVVYVQGIKGVGDKVDYSFHTVQVNALPSSPILDKETCQAPERASYYALGALWAKVCSTLSDSIDAADAAMWTLSMKPEECKKLVNSNWARYSAEIMNDQKLLRSKQVKDEDLKKTTLEAVLAACPGNVAPATIQTKIAEAATKLKHELGISRTAKQIFNDQCISCHTGSDFKWQKLSLDQVNKMLIAIYSGYMPKGGLANRDEVLKPLIDGLRDKQRQLEKQDP